MSLVIAIAIAAVGGLIGTKIGLPQGALLGSLMLISVLNAGGVLKVGRLPGPLLFFMYVLIGVELGSRVDRSTLGELGKAWIPAILFVAVLLMVTVGFSLFISKFFGMDLATALFGTSPGAISGITTMGSSFGANIPVVVAIHTLRVTVVVFAIPWIYKLLTK